MEERKAAGMIYSALAAVTADVGAVGKTHPNKQQGWKFRSIDDVFNALNPALAKHKVTIIPQMVSRTKEKVGETSRGTAMTMTSCEMKYTLMAEDGSFVEAGPIWGEGLDTGDKGTNKAMSIAYKYLCFQVFCIPTEEMIDPDAERPEMKEDAKPAGRTRSANTAAGKKAEPTVAKEQKTPAEPEHVEEAGDARITQAMLNTIRAEQKHLSVPDEAILSMHSVKAKSVSELTVSEFKSVMNKFEATKKARGET